MIRLLILCYVALFSLLAAAAIVSPPKQVKDQSRLFPPLPYEKVYCHHVHAMNSSEITHIWFRRCYSI